MQRGAEIKVGLIVLLAAALTGYFAFAIRGRAAAGTYTLHVKFDNARGLQYGDPVQMAGVKIGEVRSIDVTPEAKARLTLAIDKRFPMYEHYQVRVASSGLLQERFVEIVPATEEARGSLHDLSEDIDGTAQTDLTDIMGNGQQLLQSTQKLLDTVTHLTTQVDTVLANDQTMAQLQQTIGNLYQASQAAVKLTETANQMAGGPDIQKALHSMSLAAEDIHGATSAMRTQLAQGKTMQNVEEVSNQMLLLSQRLNQVAATLADFTGDESVKSDLRGMITDVRATAASVRTIADNFAAVSEETRKAAPMIPKAAANVSDMLQTVSEIKTRITQPQIQPTFDMLYSPHDSRVFSSGWLDFTLTPNRFLRAGVDDIGETSGVNIQIGDKRGARTLRYGLVRSRLGIGMDLPIWRSNTLSVDAFDPNDPRVDALIGVPITKGRTSASLLVGARDLGKDALLVGGVRLSR